VIHFVVITGVPSAVARLSSRLLPALEQTRYFDGDVRTTKGASGTWAAAAISVADPLCSDRFVFDDERIVIVNGPALPADAGNGLSVLLDRFTTRGSAGIVDALRGAYNFVGITPTAGLRAFADFSGMFPMYWHTGPDYAVFSNRSTTIASIVGSAHWETRALAWVISHANLRGEQMPAGGVSYLRPGLEARVDPGSTDVRVAPAPTWVWPSRAGDPPKDNLTAREWDDLTDDLVSGFRALGTLGQRVRLLLSGGKDSRLCLALAKAAGLRDCILTVTNGPEHGPEVECATEVARVAGFPHVRIGPDVQVRPDEARGRASWPTLPWIRRRRRPASFDAEQVWRRLRQHAYRYEAIVTAWDGTTDPLAHTTMNIRGVGGELYRRGSDKAFRHMDLSSPDDMLSIISKTSDPLGVLRASTRADEADWLRAWTHETAADIRLDALPEKWYVDYRLGHWNGPLSQSKAGYIIVAPILSAAAAAKNLELSATARSSERLHFEVMRRAAPELVRVPFLNDTWAAEVAADATVELPSGPFPTTTRATQRALASWQYLFLDHQRREIERLFDDAARNTDMGSICDLRKLEKQVRTATEVRGGPMQVITCVGVALALLGRAERVVDHCPPHIATEA
jgi:hypothetical protein